MNSSSKYSAKDTTLPIRGFLLHVTHYDPDWWKAKDKEEPFDLDVALDVVDCGDR